MNFTEQGARVASEALASMKSTPLAIALLIVNLGFLVFAGYLLAEIAANAKDRNKSQLAMIDTLIKDCRASNTNLSPRWPGERP
jgi:hypothetical protein